MNTRSRFVGLTLAALWPAFCFPAPSLACSACFGDPNSSMAKGAVAGVLVMVGVVGFVLLGVAGTGLYWVHRSRVIARVAEGESRG